MIYIKIAIIGIIIAILILIAKIEIQERKIERLERRISEKCAERRIENVRDSDYDDEYDENQENNEYDEYVSIDELDIDSSEPPEYEYREPWTFDEEESGHDIETYWVFDNLEE